MKIKIIENPPVIFTKDKTFATHRSLRPGDVIYLPDDAVLVVLPEPLNQQEQCMNVITQKKMKSGLFILKKVR